MSTEELVISSVTTETTEELDVEPPTPRSPHVAFSDLKPFETQKRMGQEITVGDVVPEHRGRGRRETQAYTMTQEAREFFADPLKGMPKNTLARDFFGRTRSGNLRLRVKLGAPQRKKLPAKKPLGKPGRVLTGRKKPTGKVSGKPRRVKK